MKMCPAFWKFGECQLAGKCPDRHPVQVCTRYLNDNCKAGNNCVQQHPENPTKQNKTEPPKSPASVFTPTEPTSYYTPGFAYAYMNQNTPQFHAQQSPSQAGPIHPHVQQPGQHSQQPQPHLYASPQQYSAQGNLHSHPGQSLGQGWLQ